MSRRIINRLLYCTTTIYFCKARGVVYNKAMEQNVFSQLGPKTFFLLLIHRLWAGLLFLILAFVVNLLSRPFPLLWDISLIGVGLGVFLLFISICAGWLDYYRYRIELADDSISITRGVIRTKEAVIPYKRIQNIMLERGIFDQIIGTSHLRFSISHAEGEQQSEMSRIPIILPALQYALAEHLQNELMKRANTDNISIKRDKDPRDTL